MIESESDINRLKELYESLGRALYRHTVLEHELELAATSITTIRAEIHSIETNKVKK